MSQSDKIKKLPSMLRFQGEAGEGGVLWDNRAFYKGGIFQMMEDKKGETHPTGPEPAFGAYHQTLLKSMKGVLDMEAREQALQIMMENAGRCLSSYYERHPDELSSSPEASS